MQLLVGRELVPRREEPQDFDRMQLLVGRGLVPRREGA